jgi:hypothetical protein
MSDGSVYATTMTDNCGQNRSRTNDKNRRTTQFRSTSTKTARINPPCTRTHCTGSICYRATCLPSTELMCPTATGTHTKQFSKHARPPAPFPAKARFYANDHRKYSSQCNCPPAKFS